MSLEEKSLVVLKQAGMIKLSFDFLPRLGNSYYLAVEVGHVVLLEC